MYPASLSNALVSAPCGRGLVGPFGNDAVCRVEAVGQHGLRVGEVLRVPEVDGVEGHGVPFFRWF